AITIATGGGNDTIHAGSRNQASAIADAGNVKFSPDEPTLSAVAGGSLTDGKTYHYKVTATYGGSHESLPGTEAKLEVPSSSTNKTIHLSWGSVPGATGYKIYRSTTDSDFKLVGTTAGTSFDDDGSVAPTTAAPTEDANSGVGIAVGVTVAVVTTKAYVAKNVTVNASKLTLETTAGTGASTYKAQSTSGAGGSSVGVAGSIAVNVVVSNNAADVEGTDPVAINGDLVMSATSNLDNQAIATARQAADPDSKAS